MNSASRTVVLPDPFLVPPSIGLPVVARHDDARLGWRIGQSTHVRGQQLLDQPPSTGACRRSKSRSSLSGRDFALEDLPFDQSAAASGKCCR